jgi:hypothetical protein
MVRSWSQGAAFAIATIGDQTGSTRVYDPRYPADLYDVTIEQIILNTTGADPAEVKQIANVHYTPSVPSSPPPSWTRAAGRCLCLARQTRQRTSGLWMARLRS